jgi:hypothetical protein
MRSKAKAILARLREGHLRIIRKHWRIRNEWDEGDYDIEIGQPIEQNEGKK